MTYTENQLAALVKFGFDIAQADGRVDQKEQIGIAYELSSFGVNENTISGILTKAVAMGAPLALATITNMTNEQKKYACGYLAAIMAADGEIKDSEVKLWQLISTLADFPKMSILEAFHFWQNH